VVQRWQQLPLDHASSCLPHVRRLLEDLAGELAPRLPDLGPAVVMDQLTVLVYDAFRASRAGEAGTRHTDAATVTTRLVDLRRQLRSPS